MLIDRLEINITGQSGSLYELKFSSSYNQNPSTYINWSRSGRNSKLKNIENLFDKEGKLVRLHSQDMIHFSIILSIMEEVTECKKDVRYKYRVPEGHFIVLAGNKSDFELNGRTAELGRDENGKFYFKLDGKIIKLKKTAGGDFYWDYRF